MQLFNCAEIEYSKKLHPIKYVQETRIHLTSCGPLRHYCLSSLFFTLHCNAHFDFIRCRLGALHPFGRKISPDVGHLSHCSRWVRDPYGISSTQTQAGIAVDGERTDLHLCWRLVG